MTDAIRVLICEGDPLARVALKHFVSLVDAITVVGEAGSGIDAIAAVDRLQPDIVMMDVQMPGMNGIDVTQTISTKWPEVCVVAITTLATRESVLPMLSAGASGYVLKDSNADEIIDALRKVHQGEIFISPQIAAMLVQHVRETPSAEETAGLEPLTNREAEVLTHLALGMSNTEMSKALYVSEGTIKAHLGAIMSKWQVRDRVQVLVAAARAGLVDFSQGGTRGFSTNRGTQFHL